MSLTKLARRLMRRAVRTPATAPIRTRLVGRTIEQLEDRTTPTTVTIPGGPGGASSWIITDEFTTSNGLPSGGGGTTSAAGSGANIIDASLSGQGDAYDFGGSVWVNNTLIGGLLTQTGSTVNYAPVSIAGLNATMQYYVASASGTVRIVATLSNPTGSTINVPVDYATNMGSDGGTVVQTTSNGNNLVETADRWVITDDSTVGGDPANTTVLFGPGSPAVTTATISQTVWSSAGTEGILARYNMSIPAGQTRSLMWFQKLNTTTALATSEAPTFFDTNPAVGGDLLSGLTGAQLGQIANWSVDPNFGFELGNFTNWNVFDQAGGSGTWSIFTGTGLAGFPTPQGSFAAQTSQSGPGSHVLYRDIAVPLGTTTLTAQVGYRSFAAMTTQPTLSYTVSPNQQYRVDIMTTAAGIQSVAPGDVLLNVFQTVTGGPMTLAPTTITANLTPFAGTTIRLRFAQTDNQSNFYAVADNIQITTNSTTDDYDDAPASYGTAQHTAAGVQLGAARDAEAATFDTALANGDDTNGTDDEDGVTFGPLAPGGQGTVTVTVTGGGGLLQGWVDWNNDGVFGGGEQIITNAGLGTGTITLNFPVPAGAVVGNLVSRFRISSGPVGPTGAAPNGEVEDHLAAVSVPTVVYVSPTFTTVGATLDGDLTAAGVQSATVGYDAFATIAQALSVVAANGTVIINTAVYGVGVTVANPLTELRSYGATMNSLTTNAAVGLSGTFNVGGAATFNNPVTLIGSTTLNAASATFNSTVNSFSAYQFVGAAVTFATAQANAAGMGGYLATITSAAENALVFGLTGGGSTFIGGSDAAVEGEWRWLGGPEAGVQFSSGATPVGGMYTNWAGGEPNDAGGEDALEMVGGGTWNDIPVGALRPYVVEFGGAQALTVTTTGATAFNGVVGGTSKLNTLSVNAGTTLLVGAAVNTTNATTLLFGQGGGSTATINGGIAASAATVTGGGGADTITVNATAAAPALTVNGAGGSDTYNVNAGAAQLGTVAIADNGAGGTDAAFLNGTAGADVFNVNNSTAGARTVTVGGNAKVTYSTPVTLEQLTLSGTGGGDTYNVSYANGLLPGSALPTNWVRVDAGSGTDVANVTGTSNPDAININSTTARRVILGSENVDYTTALESLVVNGGDETGLTGDTFTVTPDSPTAITINGGTPNQPSFPGDTLILNALGLTGAAIAPNPALPSGAVTSTNKATVMWTGIETFPVPLGMGGTFDFDAVRTTQTQDGWFSVLPSDTLSGGAYSFAQVGWVSSPLAYDRDGTNGYFPPPGPLSKMWRDGAWGFQGPSEARDFRVSVQANQPIQITALLGDTATINDSVDVLVSSDGVNFTLLNPAPDTFQNSLDKGYRLVSYSGDYTPTTTALTVRIRDNAGNYFWTIAGLDVRPLGLRAPITITRADANGSPVEADGLTVDTYNAIGAPGPVLVTVAPQYGTPVGVDADAMTAGFQVTAAADGSFSFQVRRSTGEGPSVVAASDVGGGAKGSFTQTYVLPAVRRIDFGPTGAPVATGVPAAEPYLGVAGEQYTSRVANALGWVGEVTATDRGAGSSLQRDLVYGTAGATRDFRINMPGPGTYFVTVVLGDAGFARDGMFVSLVNTGTLAVTSTPVSGVSTPAGQSASLTFTAVADANGEIRLRFGDASGDLFWTVQALEVRPTQGVITIGGATSVPADGSTLTTYTLSGATPNTLVTVTASAGQITTADAGGSYVGFQVLTDGSGAASFVVESPQATSDIAATLTADETTGARVAAPYTVTFTGTTGGGGGTTAYRFDFNGGGVVNTAGFVSVRGSDTFSTLAGYGWTAAQNEFERTAASVSGKGVIASQVPLYQDGAWGFGSGVFQVAVTKNETNLAARIYVGDSYTNWPYIVLNVEGGTPLALNTSATPFGAYTLTGGDANGDGKWDITISSGYVWVVNGIDVASGGATNLPALPQSAAPGVVKAEGDVVTGSELAPVVAAAIDRLAAAGNLTAAQVAQLRDVRFVVGDLPAGHLGEHVGGLVRLDADAGGRGWFVDPTPRDDAEFTPVSATEAVGGRGVDLLTVVMHELSHELGATDVDAAFDPDSLMTESLGAGVRRLPNGGSWALSVGVQLTVAEEVEVVGPVAGSTVRPVALVKEESVWADAPAVSGAVWSWSDAPTLQPDWFADDLLGGVRVA